MDAAFLALEKAKQEKILNAAFQEFSDKGYEQASTNRIAKEAGIGKGTLFYYFGNKEKLFQYLINEAFDIAYREYLSKIDFDETDFFKRLEEMSILKWQVYARYEQALGFMAHILMHAENYVLPEDLNKKRKQAEEIWDSLLTRNIDFSKFREDLPKDTVLNFIRWTIEGYRSELEQRFKQSDFTDYTNENLKPYYEEFYRNLNYLKKIYYKESEYL